MSATIEVPVAFTCNSRSRNRSGGRPYRLTCKFGLSVRVKNLDMTFLSITEALVMVEPAKLVTKCNHQSRVGISLEHSFDSGVHGADFPLSANWLIAGGLSVMGHIYFEVPCEAKVVVIVVERPSVVAQLSGLEAVVEQAARRNTSKSPIVRVTWKHLEELWLTELSIFSVFLSSQAPHDVVLYFPRSNREIWISSAVLAQASPYFKTMFDSDFKESYARHSSESAVAESTVADLAATEDGLAYDSCDEVDQVALKLAANRTKLALPRE